MKKKLFIKILEEIENQIKIDEQKSLILELAMSSEKDIAFISLRTYLIDSMIELLEGEFRKKGIIREFFQKKNISKDELWEILIDTPPHK